MSSPPGTARQQGGELRQDLTVATVSRTSARRKLPGMESRLLAYLSLYRKYRSQSFGDLLGQDHVVRILQNGIGSGRIAHAYLFTGPRGTGKTSTARLLAKALCCERGPSVEPCNECHICQAITENSLMDVIELDAASESGVDDVRENIVGLAEYRPAIARYKIFIIDEVHDLSQKAFDALLKTIEEPPAHVVFVLATTDYNKVPPTIRSRCQKFEFHRGSISDLVKRLTHVAQAEEFDIEPAAISAIARMADGGFRDALTLMEQAALTSGGRITLQHVYDQLGLIPDEAADEILLAIKNGDVPGLISKLGEISRLGRDPKALVESLLHRLADLTRAAYGIEGPHPDANREALVHEAAAKLGRDEMLRLRAAIGDAHRVLRDVTLPRLWLEAELVSLAARPPKRAQEPEPAKPPKEPNKAAAPPKADNAQTAQEPSGDPALDQAREIWSRTVAALPENTPIAIRLRSSSLRSLEAGQAVVELSRQMDVEWLVENPKRGAHVAKLVQDLCGQEWKISYAVSRTRTKPQPEPPTVELLAEGQKLADLTREILGSGAGKGESKSDL